MSLIVGDINAHHSRWDTNTSETKTCEQLADEIDTADCTIHKENVAMRLPTNSQSNSPDIRLASNDTALLSVWPAIVCTFLITVNFDLSTIDGPPRTYISFKYRHIASMATTSYKKSHDTSNKGVQFAVMTYLDSRMIAHKFILPPIRLAGDNSKIHLRRQYHQLPLTGTASFTLAYTNQEI